MLRLAGRGDLPLNAKDAKERKGMGSKGGILVPVLLSAFLRATPLRSPNSIATNGVNGRRAGGMMFFIPTGKEQ